MSSRLRRRIDQLSELDKLLTDLRHSLASLPDDCREDVADDLREVANSLWPAGGSSIAGPIGTGEDGHSVADRMREWLLRQNNEPSSIQDIADAIGAEYESVKSVLYKRNRGRFIQSRTASPGNPALWRVLSERQLPELSD